MRKLLSTVVFLASAWLSTSAPASAQVRLAIDDGRVSLAATNATVSQILAEWAKVGQTKIVNGERVTGSVVTLELSDVSETDALEVILRSASGYLLAPRPTAVRHASRYDRILILPTSSPVRAPAAAATPAPTFPRPQFNPAQQEDESGGQGPFPPGGPPTGNVPGQPGRAPSPPPAFNAFPQPMQPAAPPPPAPAKPTTSPTVPMGVPVPGMATPVPAQPPPPSATTGR